MTNVKVIQFEYNHLRAHSGYLLKDFYTMLGEKFLLGKLGPDGVYFSQYTTIKEDFRGPNYVAVRRDQVEYLRIVAAPSVDISTFK